MTYIRVKGFQIFKDRHGKMRCYHRATRKKIDLEKTPIGSAGFFAECNAIHSEYTGRLAQEPRPGTLGGLVRHYFSTDHFANLADNTRRDYRSCAAYIEAISDTPSHRIDTPLVAAIHDKAAQSKGWRRANMLRTFMSEVFKHAIPKGLISENYATNVIPKRRPKQRAYANRPWTDQERTTVLSEAPPNIKAAISLMMCTGLDPSDALALERSAIENGVIWGRRGKTQTTFAIPISPTLEQSLAEAPSHNAPTILASSRGQSWTYNGFSTVWHRFKKKLEEDGKIGAGLTLKGLRHTVATTLREAGEDERRIADYLGQKTAAMALHYSRSANLAAKNMKTMETLERSRDTTSKLSNHSDKLSN